VGGTLPAANLGATSSNCTGNNFAQGLNAGGTPICAGATGAGSFLQAGAASFTPAASSGYLFGQSFAEPPNANVALVSRIYVGRAGTLTRADYYQWCGTNGSAGVSTIVVTINDATTALPTTISSQTCTAGVTASTTGSTAVNAGDYLKISFNTPAWTTAPIGVRLSATVTIQ